MVKGRNLANPSLRKSYSTKNENYNDYNVCIFLSHISEDKEHVKEIGEYIKEAGFDIYLDIYDSELQKAADNGDHEAITQCIENGIKFSTHLMCIISEETKNKRSWWVPYEIGFGKSSDIHVSSLLLKNFDKSDIPSYLYISEIIYGAKSLNNYLMKIFNKSGALMEQRQELILKSNAILHSINRYLEFDK